MKNKIKENVNMALAFAIGVFVSWCVFIKADYDHQIEHNKTLVTKGCKMGTAQTEKQCDERRDVNYLHTLNDDPPHRLFK